MCINLAHRYSKIVQWRKTELSSGQITELLSEDGVEIVVRTVERIIAEEGLPKLARRTRIKTGMTVKGAQIPERSQIVSLADLNGQRLISDTAGVYLFAPLLCQLDIASIANSAGLPGSKVISAVNYLLSLLNSEHNVKFITLRRRGGTMVDNLDKQDGWKKIQIPPEKRKYPNPRVHESFIGLRNYTGTVRQVIVRDNGREKPAFLITNDFDMPVDLLVGNYARRWRVENGIAEAVKFFHLNALSSPIVTKVQFDIALTMVADTLYTMLAKKLRGFEDCDAPKLYRHFVRGKGTVTVDGRTVNVIYPKRAHNPILRQVPWDNLPLRLPGLGEAKLTLNFS
jgi:hypothetical protein